jgi:hypothetical protein
MSNYVDFAALKQRHPIESAIALLGLAMKQVNQDQWRGPCPTCKAAGDRAIVLTKSKGVFYCFGAKTGGDIIALVSHIRGTDTKTSALFIAGASQPEERGFKENVRSLQASPPNTNLAAIADRLDREHEECVKLNLSSDTLKHFGAGYEKKGVARGHVICQLHDGNGQLRGYCGLNKPWWPNDLTLTDFVFNWHRIEESEIYLMRSPLEVLTAYESGITNAISFLTPDISALQLRYLAELCEKRGATLIL